MEPSQLALRPRVRRAPRAMAALRVLLLALLAALGSAQSPSCIDTDATFIEVIDVLETVMSNSIAINSMMDPLVEAFCAEAPTSPLCTGEYVFTPSRPGGAAGCPTEQVYCPIGGGALADTCNPDCAGCAGFTTAPPDFATTPGDTCM